MASVSLLLLLRSRLERLAQITDQFVALLQFGRRYYRPQTVHDVLRLAEVDLIKSVADFVLHILTDTRTSLLHGDTCQQSMAAKISIQPTTDQADGTDAKMPIK